MDSQKEKIEKAKTILPEASKKAIENVDWKTVVFNIREEKKYSFAQIEVLGIQTDLLLCGLLNPEDYLKELEKGMSISKDRANELVAEMNEKVFSKIREELIKNTQPEKTIETKIISADQKTAEPVKNVVDTSPKIPSILTQKLSGSFQIPKIETEHTLANISKGPDIPVKPKDLTPKVDPYREIPE